MGASDPFYGADQAAIHHEAFGDLAALAAAHLLSALDAAGLREGTVVDLGCGSGILARIVSDAGYHVRGVDISEDMLGLARANAPRATFAQGSLLDAELPHAVAVTAIGEPLNYATDPRAGLDEVERLAARVRAALDPRGVFLFDVATPGRHGVDVVRKFHEREDWSMFVRLEEHDGTLDRRMRIFRATGEDGLFRRTDEHHVLRLYEPAALTAALERAGFAVEIDDDYGAASASTPSSGWIVVEARPG
jgi:SAM-dependent methyltransferase